MKKIILILGLVIINTLVSAQSLDQGKKYLYNERYNSAESVFHDLLRESTANAELWFLLTKSYILQNKPDKAKDSLNLAPSSIKTDPYYAVSKGYLFLIDNMKEAASLHFNLAIDKTKAKDAGILSAIAEAHIDSKNGSASFAEELLRKAIKRNKHDANLYVLLGKTYRKMNNGTEAYKAYKKAIEKNDHLAAAYYELGKIFVTQKNAQTYLEYFNQALSVDPNYAPAYYELYHHYFPIDAAKAIEYYKQYLAVSDKTPETDYAYTDLLYLNKQYTEAIQAAKKLLLQEGDSSKARLYKLIAYSYHGLHDTLAAIGFMRQYFANQADSNFIVKDYETMAEFYASIEGKEDSAIAYYQKAANLSTDASRQFKYYEKLAALSRSIKDYASEAEWLEKNYTGNDKATNLDLFNWGLAHYRAEQYTEADSVFGVYVQKYPEQSFGYYWRARSNVAMDNEMKKGLAVPHYQKLVEVVSADSLGTTDKKWLIEAYAYLAAYEANVNKNYEEAIDYFRKLLELDPGNSDAERYISILEKSLAGEGGK